MSLILVFMYKHKHDFDVELYLKPLATTNTLLIFVSWTYSIAVVVSHCY